MIRNQYNQVPHLTKDTIWEMDKKPKENIKYKRAKRSALSQQLTTRLQETDMTRNTNNRKRSTKEAPH